MTGRTQYTRAGNLAGVNLVNEPDKAAADMFVAAKVAVLGLQSGMYTGIRLDKFINDRKTNFYYARQSVNRLKQAAKIKDYAKKYLEALQSCQPK